MAYGFKSGGRKKGSVNKRTLAVAEMLDSMGVNPIESMARLAVKAEASGNDALAAKLFCELAPFCFPKQKATEITVNDDWRDFDYQAAVAKSKELLRATVVEYEGLPSSEKQAYLDNLSRSN